MREDADDDLFLWRAVGNPDLRPAVPMVYRRMMQRRGGIHHVAATFPVSATRQEVAFPTKIET